MKTIHRIMYENLTPENYKRFCKNIKPVHVKWFYSRKDIENVYPSYILFNGFLWENSPEGEGYWDKVFKALRKKEMKILKGNSNLLS